MQNRFNNPINLAKNYIDNNKFGKIICITAESDGQEIKVITIRHIGGTWVSGGALTNQGIPTLIYYIILVVK